MDGWSVPGYWECGEGRGGHSEACPTQKFTNINVASTNKILEIQLKYSLYDYFFNFCKKGFLPDLWLKFFFFSFLITVFLLAGPRVMPTKMWWSGVQYLIIRKISFLLIFEDTNDKSTWFFLIFISEHVSKHRDKLNVW